MRHGAGRRYKRALESSAMELPERSAGIETVSQGQTPHSTAGAWGSQILTIISLELPTPTVSTVPPAVPSVTYSTPPPVVPASRYPSPPPPVPATAYPTLAAPVTPVPTAYSAPAPAVLVAPYMVPPPTVPLTAPTYIDPAVPPEVPAPAYVAALGVPPLAYPVVPLVVPDPVIPPIPTTIPTHPTDMVVIAGFGNSSYIEALDRALMIEATQQRANLDKKRKQIDQTSG
ncbi:proline-rich extensin-like protein EPR1 [Zingiber officinale]|uniref:proline-rich extensin-like protein EPR1 n=1 Tax=Zingiber officinale TaxID=94328 RepID=UPI001C4B4223|nr:proline-rich extensin-like protein EPR1 [Zingiber officinale]